MDIYALLAFLVITTGPGDGGLLKLPLFEPYCVQQAALCKIIEGPPRDGVTLWNLQYCYETKTSPTYINWQMAGALPTRDALSNEVDFARGYRSLMEKHYEFCGNYAYYEVMMECDILMDGYRDLIMARSYYDAIMRSPDNNEYMSVIVSSNLMSARDKLGDCIEVGLLPPVVPLWRFQRIP